MVVELLVPAGCKVDSPVDRLVLCASVIALECRVADIVEVGVLSRTEYVVVSYTLRERECTLKTQVLGRSVLHLEQLAHAEVLAAVLAVECSVVERIGILRHSHIGAGEVVHVLLQIAILVVG